VERTRCRPFLFRAGWTDFLDPPRVVGDEPSRQLHDVGGRTVIPESVKVENSLPIDLAQDVLRCRLAPLEQCLTSSPTIDGGLVAVDDRLDEGEVEGLMS